MTERLRREVKKALTSGPDFTALIAAIVDFEKRVKEEFEKAVVRFKGREISVKMPVPSWACRYSWSKGNMQYLNHMLRLSNMVGWKVTDWTLEDYRKKTALAVYRVEKRISSEHDKLKAELHVLVRKYIDPDRVCLECGCWHTHTKDCLAGQLEKLAQ